MQHWQVPDSTNQAPHLLSQRRGREASVLAAIERAQQRIHIMQLSGLIQRDRHGLVIQAAQVVAARGRLRDRVGGVWDSDAHRVKERRAARLEAQLARACAAGPGYASRTASNLDARAWGLMHDPSTGSGAMRQSARHKMLTI